MTTTFDPGRLTDPGRLSAVAATGLLDRPSSPGLDRLARLAARLLDVPAALVTLVTADRQVFAAQRGLPPALVTVGETPLSSSICRYVVEDDAPLILTDTRTERRLAGNAAVDQLGVLAYAGMPIRVAGQTLGSFCAVDGQPRPWSSTALETLEDLAAAAASEIALIRTAGDAEEKAAAIAAILQVSHDAYVSIDESGLVLEWNPAAERLFGWSRAEAVGTDIATLVVPAPYRAAHRAGLQRVRATGRSALPGQRIELPAVDRSGRTFPVDLSLQVTEVLGRPVFHAFLHDVSVRQQAEEELHRINGELERANVLKLDLMGMLSHDIGTPLSTIIGHSDLMLAQDLAPQASAPLSKIHRAARRIDQLRHNVLSMCRLDADTILPDRQPVALAGALLEALDAAGADLPVDCPDELHVLADPAHVQQIVVNLLTNAAKYGGGATAVTARTEGGTVTIGVHDEGAGVPAALRDRLFDRFTRADHLTAAGHGLGLHIVASLAEANGGAVAHHDNDPAGSVFTLTLAAASH